jgi:hypothetical protein
MLADGDPKLLSTPSDPPAAPVDEPLVVVGVDEGGDRYSLLGTHD